MGQLYRGNIMSQKFINKVNAERRILLVVNEFTQGSRQLAGLTRYAIKSWTIENGLNEKSEVTSILYSLGDLCHRLSDRSHESFESIDDSVSAEIDGILVTLHSAISKSDMRHSSGSGVS